MGQNYILRYQTVYKTNLMIFSIANSNFLSSHKTNHIAGRRLNRPTDINIDLMAVRKPCHNAGRSSPNSHGGNPGSRPRQFMTFAVDKVALGKFFSEYFGCPDSTITQLLHIHSYRRIIWGMGKKARFDAQFRRGSVTSSPQQQTSVSDL
jgi:hypothetical protein